MRRRKRQHDAIPSVITAVAWYDPIQYQRLQEAAADADQLEPKFDDWLRGATRLIEQLKQGGIRVERVAVNVEELVRWCHEHGCLVDGAARAKYACVLAQQSHRAAGGQDSGTKGLTP
jgi:hypothetical protein